MKVLRICSNGVFEDMLFNSLQELHSYLQELHAYGVETDEDVESIYSLTLDQLCNAFDWSYEFISDEEAKEFNNI